MTFLTTRSLSETRFCGPDVRPTANDVINQLHAHTLQKCKFSTVKSCDVIQRSSNGENTSSATRWRCTLELRSLSIIWLPFTSEFYC